MKICPNLEKAMQVSVIICTRNRASQLERALSSLTRMRVPDGLTWELVIVDNGSTDATPAAVDAFAGRLPVRRVFEPMAGLSNARNRGVDEARGAYICWTDDDVEVDPEWLAAYADAFKRYPEAAVFGGVIQPVTEIELPHWWKENWEALATVLAWRDFGPADRPLSMEDGTIPFGANYAVRTVEQRNFHYDPNLGVGPNLTRVGEETTVIEDILLSGQTGVWLHSPKVRHIIPGKRLSLDYIAQYYKAQGETWGYTNSITYNRSHSGTDPVKRFRGAPLWAWRRAISDYVSYRFFSKKYSKEYLRHYMMSNYALGIIKYYRHNT